MANVIYNDRESNSTEWTIVVKGIKYLTLEYKTTWEGKRDVTMKFAIADESELIFALNAHGGRAIVEGYTGPRALSTVKHEAVS